MAVPVESVPYWWLSGGVGHALLSECLCGRCEARWLGLCGATGRDGERTAAVPAAICPECLARLATAERPEAPIPIPAMPDDTGPPADLITDAMAEAVGRAVGRGKGYMLLVFADGREVEVASNAAHSTMIQALHYVLDGLEGETPVTSRSVGEGGGR
jgi:hypothetical protein